MRRANRTTFGLAIAVAVLLGSVSVANAQYQPGYYPPPPPPAPRGMYRDGLVIGGGLGFGGISADQCGDVCGGVFSFEGHIGGMMNPRMAVMIDLWANVRNSASLDSTVWNGIYTGALQYWLTDIVWLKGGIGAGHMQVTDNGNGVFAGGDEWGLAIMGAGGVELVQAGTFAMDLQLRLGHGFFSQGGDVNSLAFMAGFNWY